MKKKYRLRIIGSFLAGVLATVLVLVISTLVFHTSGVVSSSKLSYYKKLDKKYGKYYSIERDIEKNGLYTIDQKKRDEYLGKALLKSLKDPYGSYYTKSEYSELQRTYSDSYAGVGIEITEKSGTLTVTHVIKDSPAKDGGVHKGDELISVDGTKVTTASKASKLIGGDVGTDVELELKRGGQTITVKLTRSEVEEDTVSYRYYTSDNGKKVGYVKIRRFRDNTSDDFKDAIDTLSENSVEGIVIDVRDNPGGLKDEGVKCADMLLPAGKIIIEKDKSGKKKVDKSDGNDAEFQYVVLVNGNTASAAEIFTGAIKVNKGGKVIGTKTYGKGVIQSIEKLSDGSAYKFTTQEYLLPDGTAINGKGIEPDITVKSSEALNRGIQELTKN